MCEFSPLCVLWWWYDGEPVKVNKGVVVVDGIVQSIDQIRQQPIVIVSSFLVHNPLLEVVLRDDVHKGGRVRIVISACVLQCLNERHLIKVLRGGRGIGIHKSNQSMSH